MCKWDLSSEIITDPLWYKDLKKKTLRPDINSCACCLPVDASTERWEIDYLVRVFLALLILAASGGDPSLGQEELAAGTDADLIKTLSVSRNPSFAQGQARHAHSLSIQYQLHGRQHREQGRYKENNRDALNQKENITVLNSFHLRRVHINT